jgi:hypothetical protein
MKTVDLYPWEYEWAMQVAARRSVANWGKKDAAHYKKELMEDERTASAAACVCELAVAKATNRYWGGHVWHKSEHNLYRHDIADVGNNIEVRRVRTSTTAAVRRHQLGKGLVLFVARPVLPEMTSVEIFGWIDYDEAWELGTPSKYDPENTRVVEPTHLTELK